MYDIQDFEEWRASPEYEKSRQKEVKSGTEAPEILMPNSPLEDILSQKTEETIAISSVDAEKETDESFVPLVISGCFGILIGVLIASIFFSRKNKTEPYL